MNDVKVRGIQELFGKQNIITALKYATLARYLCVYTKKMSTITRRFQNDYAGNV